MLSTAQKEMIYIKQTPTGAKAHFDGDFPDLVCDLAVAYKIVEMRGAALGISVPRLVDLISDSAYIEQLAARYEEKYGFHTKSTTPETG